MRKYKNEKNRELAENLCIIRIKKHLAKELNPKSFYEPDIFNHYKRQLTFYNKQLSRLLMELSCIRNGYHYYLINNNDDNKNYNQISEKIINCYQELKNRYAVCFKLIID